MAADKPEKPEKKAAPKPAKDDPEAPGLSALGEQEGDPVEPNEPA